MGGGTTMHEAIRLGANVIGADIDPVPIVQARAALASASLAGLQSAFDHFFSRIYNKLRFYFQTECPTCRKAVNIRHTLYGIRKTCACGEAVQIDQYDLRSEASRTIQICPRSWEILNDQTKSTARLRTTRLITKPEKRCTVCGQEYTELLDLPFMRVMCRLQLLPTAPITGCFSVPSARLAESDVGLRLFRRF